MESFVDIVMFFSVYKHSYIILFAKAINWFCFMLVYSASKVISNTNVKRAVLLRR